MSYKKVGGLHFVRIGRFGFSFFWSARKPKRHVTADQIDWKRLRQLHEQREFAYAVPEVTPEVTFRGNQ